MSDRSLRRSWAQHGIVFLLVAGAVLGVALALLIGRFADPDHDTIRFEAYRLLIQALLIGAVGAFLSSAIQEIRRGRENEERLREYKRERIESVLQDIDEDYRLIRRSRRMLRLESPIRQNLYRTEMILLEDIQRSLEEVICQHLEPGRRDEAGS